MHLSSPEWREFTGQHVGHYRQKLVILAVRLFPSSLGSVVSIRPPMAVETQGQNLEVITRHSIARAMMGVGRSGSAANNAWQ